MSDHPTNIPTNTTLIDRTLQHALEYNVDGVMSYWNDKQTGQSGYVMPKYASYKWRKGPCRNFDIAYFTTSKQVKYHSGIACRRGQVWQIQ